MNILKKCARMLAFVVVVQIHSNESTAQTLRFQAVQNPQSPPKTLVLRNGSVFQGQISMIGQDYLVKLGTRGQVIIPVADVDFVTTTLERAFITRRDRADGTDSRQFYHLAQWCLRQQLYAHADEMMRYALEIDPTNVGIQDGLRRIELMRAAAEQREQSSVKKTNFAPANVGPTRSSLSNSPQLVAVQNTEAVPLADDPDVAKLDSVRDSNVGAFVTQIQPRLVNGCAAGRCHGKAATNAFRIERPHDGQAVTRQMSHRNLLAVLNFVDESDPSRSLLLDKASLAHGGATKGVFTPVLSKHFGVIEQWVFDVAADLVKDSHGDNLDSPSNFATREVTKEGAGLAGDHAQPRNPNDVPSPAERMNRAKAIIDSNVVPTSSNQETRQPVLTHQDAGYFVPIDAFDPEIFNRKYHSTTGSAEQLDKVSRERAESPPSLDKQRPSFPSEELQTPPRLFKQDNRGPARPISG